MQEMTLNVPDDLLTSLIKQRIEQTQIEMTEINWDTKTAAERTGLKRDRILAICRNQKWKHELDADNGGAVLYPYQGQGYQINPQRFTEFCKNHWLEIMNLNPRR